MTHPSVKSFSTAGLHGAACTKAWQEFMFEVYYPLESIPEDPDNFSGRVVSLDLPSVPLAHYHADALRSTHYADDAREEEFVLFFPTSRRQLMRQRGHEREIGPGEMAMLSTAEDYTTSMGNKTKCLTIRLQASALREQIPNLDRFYDQNRQTNARILSMVANLAGEFLGRPELNDRGIFDKVAQNIIDLICLMFLMSEDESNTELTSTSIISAYRDKLHSYIRSNFKRADLSAEDAATSLKISSRYVQKIFKTSGTTFGHELYKHRLKEADRMLRQPLHHNARSMQISEIAYMCGFSSQSHFSSRYKEFFGLTPRDARMRF